jgi:hypothetical protein
VSALPPDPLDQVDAAAAAATAVLGLPPDPLDEAVRADPAVAEHLATAATRGFFAARASLHPLRAAALPAAEAAAKPLAERLAALDRALAAGELAERFGADVAQRVHDGEAASLRDQMTRAVHEALAPIADRLGELERGYEGAVTAAEELPAPTPEALDALKVLLGLLPNLTPDIALGELDRAVSAAARDPGARGNLRYLLPVMRSLAARPEYDGTTDAGIALKVVIGRGEALTYSVHRAAAELLRRYADRFRDELGVVERVVGAHGTWAASPEAGVVEDRGGGMLKVVLVPPAE